MGHPALWLNYQPPLPAVVSYLHLGLLGLPNPNAVTAAHKHHAEYSSNRHAGICAFALAKGQGFGSVVPVDGDGTAWAPFSY
jgi:hypothetical protein